MTKTLSPVASRADWKGSTIDWQAEALHVLSPAEIEEVDTALQGLKSFGDLDFPEITTETFRLPTLGASFARMADELRRGRGFVLLRGLPREGYSADDMARIYYGFGVHMGRPGPQSWQGELFGNVIDVSDIEADPRGYHKGGRQNYHCDSCDVVGLMCLRSAKSGGTSSIASSTALHNALAERRPDLLEELYNGYRYRRMELDAKYGEGVIVTDHRVPVFVRTEDGLSCYYMKGYAEAAAKAGDATLTERQVEALEEMQRMAHTEEFLLDMKIEEGDIQFLNNRVVLHSRDDYVDHPELSKRRHMLRLWLQMPSWPATPAEQVLHTDGDRRKWLQQRRPKMEFPSIYLDEMARYLREGKKLVAAA